MGIFSSKDVYSPKYTTADITSSDRVWFVPIKYLIGDLFLTSLDGLLYCFQMDGTRIKTYRHLGIRSIRKIYYTINHTHPINQEKMKELEIILKKNSLPKVSNNLFSVFKNLSNKEKTLKQNESFTPHVISQMIEEIQANPNKNPEVADNLEQFCKNIGAEEIVTPIKPITEFLESDLKATNPQFMGNVINSSLLTDKMRKKVTNMPETGKNPYIKLVAILALVGLIAGVGIWAWQSGALDNALPHIGPPPNTGVSQDELIKKYPDAASAKAAIDRGEVKITDFPKSFQDMIKNAKLPVTPITPTH